MPLALLAIEILHAQRLAAFGMRSELANAAEEVAVLADVQRQREVAHRRQEHHRARLARPHVGRLLDHFSHPHSVDARIEIVEGRRIEVELVAQHDDQGAQLSHG
jgi:proline dehydrogenase